jgi:phosphocarrier protein
MSDRAAKNFTIVNDLGLHARAATKLVQLASKYPCEVNLSHQGQTANAKSVMGVLLLCGSKGTVVEVAATGERADECVTAIGELIAGRFGEPS